MRITNFKTHGLLLWLFMTAGYVVGYKMSSTIWPRPPGFHACLYASIECYKAEIFSKVGGALVATAFGYATSALLNRFLPAWGALAYLATIDFLLFNLTQIAEGESLNGLARSLPFYPMQLFPTVIGFSLIVTFIKLVGELNRKHA